MAFMDHAPTAVVTGGGRGLGFAVAEQLAADGCRGSRRARSARRRGRARGAPRRRGRRRRGRPVERAHDPRVRGALLGACPRIDVLVHNAGIWPSRLMRNEDGLEQAFATNHLAPFVLNHALEPRLAASRARVVQVTAGLAVKGRVDLERTPVGADFHAIRTYATTKLCNLVLLPRWAERWRDAGIAIDAVHPGVIRTGLGDRTGLLGGLLKLVKRRWAPPAEGARPVVRLARSPERAGASGRYFEVDREVPLPRAAGDGALAAALWSQALALGGVEEAPAASAARVA